MPWSAATLDGLLLAAAGRDASADAPGLAPPIAALLTRKLEALRGGPAGARHAELRRAALRLAPTIDGSTLPPRARALLAKEVDRERGTRWLSEAPPARVGYHPPPGIRATLSRVAGREHAPDRQDVGRTRGEGRQLLAAARRLLPRDDEALSSLRVESEEAAAVQALEALPGAPVADLRRELLRLLLRASSARAKDIDVSLALGRLLRGARRDALTAPDDSLERAGRELAEWAAATWPA